MTYSVFVVMRNSDSAEGRGPMVIDCIFTQLDIATCYVDGMESPRQKREWVKRFGAQDVYGGPTVYGCGRSLFEIREHRIFTTILDKEKENLEREKKRALAKLTPREIKLLGIDQE